MRFTLRRIAIGPMVKITVLLYLAFGVLTMPLYLLMGLADENMAFMGFGMAIVMPVFYAVFGAFIVALMCALYNFLAARVGGFEFDMDAVERGGGATPAD